MSADNTMVIQRRDDKWHVWMVLGEFGWDVPRGPWHRSFDNELAALHYALGICDTEIVEYGVRQLPAVIGHGGKG